MKKVIVTPEFSHFPKEVRKLPYDTIHDAIEDNNLTKLPYCIRSNVDTDGK